MCDTFTIFGRDGTRSFFGKNSDREPEELQAVYFSENPVKEFQEKPYQEEKEKYINNSFSVLADIIEKFDNKYSALISRPLWMFGAEMGVNEKGVAAGNEALFSNEKVKSQGLLGMDILRLTLHNVQDAESGINFIINLIENYGQGGDGGYKNKLLYHNSFLIKDFEEAFILETSGRHWAVKKVKQFDSISNTYTIEDDYDRTDKDTGTVSSFKNKYENEVATFKARGDYRHNFSYEYLANNEVNLENMLSLLRSHKEKGKDIFGSMMSICMHPGWVVKTETTSSMVVDYIEDDFVVWYTASPNPCTSIYKPFIFNEKSRKPELNSFNSGLEYNKKWKNISKLLISNLDFFNDEIRPERNRIESQIQEKIYENFKNKKEEELVKNINQGYKKIEKFAADVKCLISNS